MHSDSDEDPTFVFQHKSVSNDSIERPARKEKQPKEKQPSTSEAESDHFIYSLLLNQKINEMANIAESEKEAEEEKESKGTEQ